MADRRDSYRAGLDAEKAVGAFLRSEGWTVLEHRWRGAGAEVDLIATKEGLLRFFEVKLRAKGDPVGLEAVDARKVVRLTRAAEAFMARYDDYSEACLTVAYVERGASSWQIEFFDHLG